MKRILTYFLAMLLALCMLVGCNETPPAGTDNNPPSTPTSPSGPSQSDSQLVTKENYMPAEVYAQMKAYFESTEKGFYFYDDRAFAPLVSTDVFAISDCTVKSITIPVFSTGKADENGDLTFSIYILPNAWSALRTKMADPGEPITIKINAAEHELEENKTALRKFVKVDLSDYDIKLSATQTLGFSHVDDTIIPARVLTKGTDESTNTKYVPAKYMIDNWDVVGYYYYNTTEGTFAYTDNSLLFDFELERRYESEAAYNAVIATQAQEDADYAAKLAAVKAAYAGKSFSLIGDSISTFGGVTNNSAIHSSLSLNAVHYTLNTTVYDYTKTYWGKLSVDTGMELCVINAWSGGKAYGSASKSNGKDNMLTRSYNLITSAGKTPDVIILYYAVNDMITSYSSVQDTDSEKFTGGLPTGDLYQRLTAENKTKTDKEIVAEWFAEVETYAAQGGFDPANPNSITFRTEGDDFRSNIYTCWEASYALSLQNIKRLYPNAELFSITLPEANHGSSKQPRLGKANVVIRALVEYFEVALVEQDNSEVNKANCHVYARDAYGLHPNGRGHAAITKLIVETMYEKLPK